MKKKKVLITGTSGFLGKNVAKHLKDKGWTVVPFDKETGQDLLNNSDLEKALSRVEYVCHLAAIGDVYLAANDPKLAATVGVAGTANLVHFANKVGNVKKIIYTSTWEVYGHPQYEPLDEKHPRNPDHPYSISKYGGELMIESKLNHIPWLILRLGSAYGPYMRSNAVIPVFIDKARKGEKIVIAGNGLQMRQFTHARDIARAFEMALTLDVNGEAFNIVSDEKQTIKGIAEMINKNIPVDIEYGPKREGDVPPAVVSTKKAKKKLGWSPQISFKKGLNELIG